VQISDRLSALASMYVLLRSFFTKDNISCIRLLAYIATLLVQFGLRFIEISGL
jgi:hypothetical protein